MNRPVRATIAALFACGLTQSLHGQDAANDSQHSTASASEEANPAPEESLPTPAAESSTSDRSLLKDLRFGPHVAIGIPHPLTAGVDIIYAKTLGVSFSAGKIGTEFDDTEVEIRSWDVGVSWFPFQGSFFIGALYGNQGIVGKKTVDLDVDASGTTLTVPTTLRLAIDSNYLTPHLGWYARWDSGFSLGFDIGIQLPSNSDSELQVGFRNVSQASETSVRNTAEFKKNKKDIEDLAETLGKKAIPYINLIKLGWMF